MLVLTRKRGERIVIDGNIEVVVQKVSGNRVTLGVHAPDDVRIVRGELEPKEPVVVEFQLPAGATLGDVFSS